MDSEPTTIAAIATPPGTGGVAVIRISGSLAWYIGRTLFSRKDLSFQSGRFYHGWIVDISAPQTDTALLDEVLMLFFAAPNSLTGEDVVEIHCHGNWFLAQKILALCFSLGATAAGAGEFMKRAFLAGKVDLTQAESVMDLVSAQGERLLKAASRNLKNRSLGTYIDVIGQKLLEIQSQIVACVDFPDEVDEPPRLPLIESLSTLIERGEALARAADKNRLVRDGMKIAILGLPNAGKSSIFNVLLASERAIVTDIPGTTRDVLTECLTIHGIQVTLVDTAGIRESENRVEILGIERTWQAADEAEAILYVFDGTIGLLREDHRVLAKLSKLPNTRILLVANKMDLVSREKPFGREGVLTLSAKTGRSMEELLNWIESVIEERVPGETDIHMAINHRQRSCLLAMNESLHLAQQTLIDQSLPIDMATVPITDGLSKLDELMGRETTEEVLDQVFQEFCVGK
ncbi:MAG: tRNA uridine-5-carboxymethylaminomethyl(34) synthesis GTPase MnmE [Vampirovibrio sp.]|nr:tRNA uridine-5-carboxymethylaminomethyl(34) synthesis GTPase MnmE [Vampirovibrio sp.]